MSLTAQLRGTALSRFFLATLCMLLALLAASPAEAASTVLDTGFEPPYAPGPLQNAPGWMTVGEGSSSAQVQSTIARSGEQAVLVTRAANSDRRWAVLHNDLPTQRFITIDWDMLVSPPSAGEGFGPFIGVDAWDADNPDQSIQLLGALGVDASTRDVLFQDPFFTETGFQVAYNEWYHYRILLDFATHNYRGYVNGMQVMSSPFADGALNDFTDADIAALAANIDDGSRGKSTTAVFDNFLIRDGLAGDYDIDGDVDLADNTRWRNMFGSTVTMGSGADGNGNGVADAADYVVWRKNLGSTLFASAGSGLGSAVAIPEPIAFYLAMLAIQGLTLISARRR